MLSQYSLAGQVLYQQDDRRAIASENIYFAGSLIALRERAYSGSTYNLKYQHTDALGSPVAVTNAAGAVIERNDYEPYGTIIGKPNYQGFGFTGHLQDSETGLTYMQQRYYDPTVGRFLSVDPVTALSSPVGMFNRYKYAANNPYRFVDPDGRQEKAEREHRDMRSIAGHPGAGGMPVSGVPATATDRQKNMVAVASSGVFHVTSLPRWDLIRQSGSILPNPDGLLPTTFGSKNSYFRKRGCVSVFDYRVKPPEDPMDYRHRCHPLQPAQPDTPGIAILFLHPDAHPKLLSWELCRDEVMYRERVVPYVEAGHPGPIPVTLVERVVYFRRTEDPDCLPAILRRSRRPSP